MLKLLLIIVFVLYSTALTWTLYLAVMAMKDKRDQLTAATKVFAYPILIIGLLVDVIYNLTAGTIIFLEIPREWLFTTRCERHLLNKTIRGNIARWLCRNFLDPFEPSGKHCG